MLRFAIRYQFKEWKIQNAIIMQILLKQSRPEQNIVIKGKHINDSIDIIDNRKEFKHLQFDFNTSTVIFQMESNSKFICRCAKL